LREYYAKKAMGEYWDRRNQSLLKKTTFPARSRWWHVGDKCEFEAARDNPNYELPDTPDLEESDELPNIATALDKDILKKHCKLLRMDMGDEHASRLVDLLTAFGCPEHFLALKRAIIHYRALHPESTCTVKKMGLPSQLYQVGLWTEHLGLINTIVQRYVRTHFAYMINKEKGSSGRSLGQAVKVVAESIYPNIVGWDKSDEAKRSTFIKIQKDLLRWRRDSKIWSEIQTRFSSRRQIGR
jgi:hypothetical protein